MAKLKLPMPPTDKAQSEKNSKEQYEALGRFVEAFELMVDEIRGTCLDRIWEAVTRNTGLAHDPDYFFRKMLIDIPLHQQNMTAKPLWDVARSVVTEIVSQEGNAHHTDRAKFKSLLGSMEGELGTLMHKRNTLLHGTWLIGFTSEDDPNNEKFRVRKFQTTADGLQQVKELPQDVSQLSVLTKRCDELRSWVAEVDWCLRKTKPLSDHFKYEKKKWFHRHFQSSTDWTTLPDK